MVGKSSPVLRRTRCRAGVVIKQGPSAGVWKALPTHRRGKSPRPARSAAVASFHPSIPTLPGAQRKEEASCQRVTQIARCSTAPPASGTPPVPKPSPHHATPPQAILPSSSITPDQPRAPPVLSALFFQSKGTSRSQETRFQPGLLVNERLGNSKEGATIKLHLPRDAVVQRGLQLTLQTRTVLGGG